MSHVRVTDESIHEAAVAARGLSPGPLPVLASAGQHPDAGVTPNVKPTRAPLDAGCSALGAGPGATRASPMARVMKDPGWSQAVARGPAPPPRGGPPGGAPFFDQGPPPG